MDGKGTFDEAVLLLSCPDQRGIVAAVAEVLYRHGANILEADQHSDREAVRFFQRIHIDMRNLHSDRGALEGGVRELAERFDMDWRIRYTADVKKIAIFVSKTDHCLYDLLLRRRAGELRCDVPIIVSNHETHRSTAELFGIDYHVFEITPDSKREREREQLQLLAEHDVELVVLARYMQILSDDFLSAFAGEVINIHHSFLPAFIGGRPYHQAYERGVKLIGATAHYATRDLDEGPIIEQDVVRASHRHSVDALIESGRDVERRVLSRAVRWHLEDRVLVHGGKTVIFS